MTQLAMPAGSMQSGLIAFRDGADAIYLGLQSFSARKGAVNFDIEEYSKIYRFAQSNNKKVYVTINTVVHDPQLSAVIRILKQIEIVGSDGVIVQDLGIAKIIKDHFPTLELHGSTQLAVHSIKGVKAMQDFGFKRVVLSRELNISEIEKIRNACKDVELKVFIHGALCYGFSGLCMASHVITKRSANAGACAQICRTWFTHNNKNGFFFSMKDLDAADSVKRLRDINIDSLKVEGRMKSPSYVSAVTKYYRAILEDEPYEHLYKNVKTTFSRESSKGWLDTQDNLQERKVDINYPSHKGLKAAIVEDLVQIENSKYAFIDLNTNLSLHDGVMIFREGRDVDDAVKFSVSDLLDSRQNKIKRALRGERVYLRVSEREWGIERGDFIYLIKSHDEDEKLINTDRLPFAKNYSQAKFIISDNLISIVCSFDYIGEVRVDRPLKVEKANKLFDYKSRIEKIFKQSGDSFFSVESIEIENKSSFKDSEVFIPLSEIKEMRRIFYEKVDDKEDFYVNSEIQLDDTPNVYKVEELPLRSEIKISDLPFFHEVPTEIDQLVLINEKYYLPLPPVFFDEEEQCKRLFLLIEEIKSQNLTNSVYFGINNIAHIKWLEEYNVKTYVDIYCYVANREAALNLLNTKLNIVGAYLFLETAKGDLSLWPFTPERVDKDFTPPLFISRTNFSYDSLKEERKDESYFINQRDNEYKVVSKNELTYLIKRN